MTPPSPSNNGSISTLPSYWRSLSLRLSAIFIALLIAAALAVGYLFDRGRSEALEQRRLEHLQRYAEDAANEVELFVNQLQGDVLFLAHTPPVQGMRRALEGGGIDADSGSSLEQWKERLQQIFLAFAQARPAYFQLRLIGARDSGRELVRVERIGEDLRTVPSAALQQKGHRYYYLEAASLKPGTIYLSRIDLNREHGDIDVPYQPTLRAAAPIHAPDGKLFGIVVVNMDMELALLRNHAISEGPESLYVLNEQGDFLLHPQPDRAFAFELGRPFRLTDAFPENDEQIAGVLSQRSAFVALKGVEGKRMAYLTTRDLDPQNPERHLRYIVIEPMEDVLHSVPSSRRDSLLGMSGLLLLAVVVVILTVQKQMQSLSALARASEAMAKGEYQIELPTANGSEIGSLVRAFRHMAAEVEGREQALAELNRNLEDRVKERTSELTRQHSLQKLILESIADGVVVTDQSGHFILWNRKAEQIVGSGPEDVPPAQWSSRFGIFRDEAGDPVPTDELPLVRAIHGDSTVNAELYLCHPTRTEGHWIQVTARPLHDTNDGISGAVAVLVDVTEQRRLQSRIQGHRSELVQFGRLVLGAEIAAAAAHQLSQPIAAISNYAGAVVRLQQRGRLGDNELSEILGRIDKLAGQSGEILDKLRARIRRRESAPTCFDANQVATSCLDFLKGRVERQGVKIERRYGKDLPKLVGDPIELEHALIQLASNALDAMEATAWGQRHLVVSTGHDPQANLIIMEMRDTGPGVSAALADRLFEPWETDKPGALGIGLSIAQTIIEAFGGRICIETPTTGGALFRTELPVPIEAQA